MGLARYLRMKLGQLIRMSSEPAPVGRPDYYRRELHPTLFVRDSANLPTRSFLAPDHQEASILDLARECHQKLGFYPINFSFPQAHLMPVGFPKRPHFLSSTIPGEPFSFSDWSEYLSEYRSSYWALSTKKGGWDTFRHLEILFSGGIPLMPGVSRSAQYSLAHYPKKALRVVLDSLMRDGLAVPDEETQAFFRDHATKHLSSQAMATYLLDIAGLQDSTVMFLDKALAKRTDYLSIFTLTGLKLVKENDVQAVFEPEYLFDDYTGDTTRLYGRGFGYSKSLPRLLKTQQPLAHDASVVEVVSASDAYDHIVVGNYDANRELVAEMLAAGVPATKFVCLIGSDLAADFRLRHEIHRSGMTFFVREF